MNRLCCKKKSYSKIH